MWRRLCRGSVNFSAKKLRCEVIEQDEEIFSLYLFKKASTIHNVRTKFASTSLFVVIEWDEPISRIKEAIKAKKAPEFDDDKLWKWNPWWSMTNNWGIFHFVVVILRLERRCSKLRSCLSNWYDNPPVRN